MQGAIATVHADDRRLGLCHLARFSSQRIGTSWGQYVACLTQNSGETSRMVRISAIGPRSRIDEDHDRHAHETLHPEPSFVRAALRRDFDVYVCTLGMKVANFTGFGKR